MANRNLYPVMIEKFTDKALKVSNRYCTEPMVRKFKMATGTGITIRPISPDDAKMEKDFIEGLSTQTNTNRFFGVMKHPQKKTIEFFTNIDYVKHMALIATTKTPSGEQEVAVARYIAIDDNRTCEFAVVVTDQWQHHGIGRELMSDLVKDARAKGFKKMIGTILASNRNMIGFMKHLGFHVHPVSNNRKVVEAELTLSEEADSSTLE